MAHCNARDHFSIPELSPDNFHLRSSAKGLFSGLEKSVAVRPGSTTTVAMRLIYSKAPLKNKKRL
jgi:hypothetical protein